MQGYRNKLNFRAENIALELSKTFSQCLKPRPKKSHEKNECFTKYQFHNASMAKKNFGDFFSPTMHVSLLFTLSKISVKNAKLCK